MLDLLFGLIVLVVLSGVAVPSIAAAVRRGRAVGAARYLASQLALTRVQALRRGASAALRFDTADPGIPIQRFIDGNGNGVRRNDIDRGVDAAVTPPQELSEHFPGVTFGILPGIPTISGPLAGPSYDPIRIGRSELLSFGPLGTSSSGTLYLLGQGQHQWAIRVLGGTGRIRVLHFDHARRRWVE